MALSTPSASTFRMVKLMEEVKDGKIRLPQFQRGLRWGQTEALNLVDSILRGFPVGSLLLWSRPAPAARVSLGQLTIDAPQISEALWVVDGQQRITSLANALTQEDPSNPFTLHYDFVAGGVKPRPSNQTIPLPQLFDLEKMLEWTQEHPEHMSSISMLNQAAVQLREFTLPAYIVNSNDESTLREIFDRMNNSGKRLSRAEVFSALFAEADRGSSTDPATSSISQIQEHIRIDRQWGLVDDDTILKVILARRSPDITREIRNEFTDSKEELLDTPNESQEAAYVGAQEALDRAISFLIQHDVPHFTFLPYRYLLVVLSRFFAHFPNPSPRTETLLDRWMWQAALAGPAVSRASVTGAMRQFNRVITPGNEAGSIEGLLKLVEQTHSPKAPNSSTFRANRAEGKIVLCAMWALGPVDLESGKRMTHTQISDTLEDDPTANRVAWDVLRRSALVQGNRISFGNRIIYTLPIEDAADLICSTSNPEWLQSHAISPASRELLQQSAYDAFVSLRASDVQRVVDDFVSARAAYEFENTPPLSNLEYIDPGEAAEDIEPGEESAEEFDVSDQELFDA